MRFNTNFAYFHAADTRSRAELESVLGQKYEAVLSPDDFSAYNGYAVKAQQKCLAHLRRHFKKLLNTPGLNNQKIGEEFISLIDEAFKNYASYQESQNIEQFLAWATQFKSDIKSKINQWLSQAGGVAGFQR